MKKQLKKGLIATVGILGLATATIATAKQGEIIESVSPQEVLDMAKEWGKAELSNSNSFILGVMGGEKYGIILKDCGKGNITLVSRCSSLQFFIGYNDVEKITLEQINQFNEKYRYFKAYKEDSDVRFEYDIDFDGGVTQKNIEEAFRRVSAFHKITADFLVDALK